jgi:hypothetical protein
LSYSGTKQHSWKDKKLGGKWRFFCVQAIIIYSIGIATRPGKTAEDWNVQSSGLRLSPVLAAAKGEGGRRGRVGEEDNNLKMINKTTCI